MSELDHLRKNPPDGGLPLDIKDRKLRDQCQECGVTFYIGPEETSQQTSERRESLRRSIKAAKTKMRRLAEKGSAREQARLRADRANKESKRQAETDEARTLRLHGQAVRQDLHRQAETDEAREARLQDDRVNKESKRQAESEGVRTVRLQKQAVPGVVLWWRLCSRRSTANQLSAFIGDVAKAVDDDLSFCEDQGVSDVLH